MDDTARAELLSLETARFVALYRNACRTHRKEMQEINAELFDVRAEVKEMTARCHFLGATMRTLDEEFVERRELCYAVAKDVTAIERRIDGIDAAFDAEAAVISRDLFTLKKRLLALEEKIKEKETHEQTRTSEAIKANGHKPPGTRDHEPDRQAPIESGR